MSALAKVFGVQRQYLCSVRKGRSPLAAHHQAAFLLLTGKKWKKYY